MSDYVTGCAGKLRHSTAISAAKQAKHSRHGHPYRCEYCDGWHVGNQGVKLSKTMSRHMRQKRAQALKHAAPA